MPHEKTQRKNPHGLTVNQHVFPKESIERFTQDDGFVSVHLHQGNRTVPLRPNNARFCAKRVWNQAAEQGFMKKIEDDFQSLAQQILDGSINLPLTPSEHTAVSEFYALCRLRAEARLARPTDIQINGVLPESALTKDQEEILEKNGYCFARGTTFPGRHIASIRIQMLLSRLCAPETTWAVVHSRTVEFLVPDSFREIGVVPLSPNYCLVANQIGGEITADNAIEINRIAIAQSSDYYFARDLAKCGTLKTATSSTKPCMNPNVKTASLTKPPRSY